MNRFTKKQLLIALAMSLFTGQNAWAGEKDVYSKATATVASGNGKVYVTTDGNKAPEPSDYVTVSEAESNFKIGNNDKSGNTSFYFFAQNNENSKFIGWYREESCTDIVSEEKEYAEVLAVESTDKKNPTMLNLFAKFEQIFFRSQLSVNVADGEGKVAINTESDAVANYASNAQETITKDEKQHSYFIKAAPDEYYAFEGWYKDEDCENLISKQTDYTYQLNGTDTIKGITIETIYAKFKDTRIYYRSRIKANAVGEGKVSITANSSDAHSFSTTATLSNTIANASKHTYYLNAQANGITYYFDGWYKDEDCTDKISDEAECAYETDAFDGEPDEAVVYAKFTPYDFNSKIKVITTGEGKVFVSTVANSNTEYAQEMSAEQTNNNLSQTYYISAQPNNDDNFFDGWYSDEACENLISNVADYTYSAQGVVGDAEVVVLYAKFGTSTQKYTSVFSVKAVGNGLVYASPKNNSAPAFAATYNAKNTNNSRMHTYYLNAAAETKSFFSGWYSDEACTSLLSTDVLYAHSMSAAEENAEATVYGKFTEYNKSVVKVTAIGNGRVAVAENEAEISAVVATNDVATAYGKDTEHFYTLKAVSIDKYTNFEGWYTDQACTQLLSDKAQFTASVAASQANTDEVVFYANFVTRDAPYNSKVAAQAVGNGTVFVSASADETPVFTANSSAAMTADEQAHNYKFHASADNGVKFIGWFADEECNDIISIDPNFNHLFAATHGEPSVQTVYAKFEDITPVEGLYQIPNSDFEQWNGNEPSPGWYSFSSATGSLVNTGAGLSPKPEKVEGVDGYCFHVKSNSIFGKNANGNVTTGIINMGSMTPADPANHNFSDVDNKENKHFVIIAGQPDSVSFYSKFIADKGNTNGTGNATFTFHDKYKYHDPEVASDIAEHRIGKAETPIAASLKWIRTMVPFAYDWSFDKAANTDKYMLASFTTNKTPGGSAGDELWVDKVRLIYSSYIVSASYNDIALNFENGKASVDDFYNPDATLTINAGRASTTISVFDETTGILSIRIEGQDIAENPTNFHIYLVQFKAVVPTALPFTDNDAVAADLFRTNHKSILLKPTANIAESDETLINSALADFEKQTDKTKEILASDKALLDTQLAIIDSFKANEVQAEAFRNNHTEVLAMSIVTVTMDDLEKVDEAIWDYENLGTEIKKLLADEKNQLNNLKGKIEKLIAASQEPAKENPAQKEADQFIADNATALMLSATTVSTADKTVVNEALTQFEALSDEAKEMLDAEKYLLDQLSGRIDEIEAEIAHKAAIKALADDFRTNNAEILAKTTETLSAADEEALNTALAQYDNLEEEVQILLNDQKALLTQLSAVMPQLKAIEANNTAALEFRTNNAAVLGLTKDMVALDNEADIKKALSDYRALSAEVKALVADEKTLLDELSNKIAELKAAEANKAAADNFRSSQASTLMLTDATVAVTDEEAIQSSLNAYNRLSDEVKVLLAEEKEHLEGLMAQIDVLKAAAEEQTANEIAAKDSETFRSDNDEALSLTVQTVVAGDAELIDEAIENYNKLSSKAQELLADEKVLLETLYNEINNIDEEDGSDNPEVEKFRTQFGGILSRTLIYIDASHRTVVTNALKAYKKLDEASQAELFHEKARLDTFLEKIKSIDGLPDDIDAEEGYNEIVDTIVEDDKEPEIYDLNGSHVNQITRPGIYIINGKKVLKK